MKKKMELLVLILLYILLGTFLITSDDRSSFQLLYTTVLFLSTGAIFFSNLYFLFPLLQNGFIKRFLFMNLTLLLIAYFPSAFLYASWMAEVYNYELLISHLIHPTILQDILPLQLIAMLFGTIYGSIKHLILSRKFRLLKRVMFYSIAGILAISLVFFINYQLDLNYKGNQETRFIEGQYSSLDEIIRLPQFQNKVVYVDLWFSSCTPCLREFQHLSRLKNQLKGKDVEYLYLARETSHSNSMQRWKNAIKKFNLHGWHVYMSNHLEQETWQYILANQRDSIPAAYPRYLLIDKSGELISLNAKKPSEGNKLIEEIEALLR